MNFGRVAYLVPVGFWGTRLGASVTKFDYELGEDFADLQADGDGLVKSVYAFHPIYRTRNTNVIAQFAYEDKRLHDRIDSPGHGGGPLHRFAQGRRGRRLPRRLAAAAASTPSRSRIRKAT